MFLLFVVIVHGIIKQAACWMAIQPLGVQLWRASEIFVFLFFAALITISLETDIFKVLSSLQHYSANRITFNTL